MPKLVPNTEEWIKILKKVIHKDEVISNNAFWLELYPLLNNLEVAYSDFTNKGNYHITELTDKQIEEEALYAIRNLACPEWLKRQKLKYTSHFYSNFDIYAYAVIKNHLHSLYYRKKAKPTPIPFNGVYYTFNLT